MSNTLSKSVLMVFSIAALTLSLPSFAQARDDHHGRHREDRHDRKDRHARQWGHHDRYDRHDRRHFGGHRHYPIGRVSFDIPLGHVSFVFGKQRYYYSNGHYYVRHPRNYVVVAPPPGVVVYSLPAGFTTVRRGVEVYYEYGGIYYQRTPGGYRVAEFPDAVGPRLLASASSEVYSIQVPNRAGGYTAVTLKRSGEGFVGPQGEFYDEFPSVEQLRAMYAK